MMFLNVIRIVWILGWQKKFLSVLIFTILAACFEVLGVVSVAPLIMALSNPEQLDKVLFLNAMFDFFKISDDKKVLFLGGMFLLINLASNTLILVGHAIFNKFSIGLGLKLSEKVLEKNVYGPQSKCFGANRQDLISKSIIEAQQVAVRYIAPCLRIIARAVVLMILVGVVIYSFPLLSLTLAIFIGAAYLLIFSFLKNRISKHGQRVILETRRRSRIAHDLFEGIREVKIWRLERLFLDRIRSSSKIVGNSEAWGMIFSQSPYYVVESLAFASVLVSLLWMVFEEGGLVTALPSIGLFVLVGYKMIPSMQQIYNASVSAKSSESIFNDIWLLFTQPVTSESTASLRINSVDEIKRLQVNDIFFEYCGDNQTLYRQLSFDVKAGEILVIVGRSGIGKSTLLNLFMGFLNPTKGEILINGMSVATIIQENFYNTVSYVGQKPTLFDMTVRENILLGEVMDEDRLKKVLDVSMVSEFIQDLPEGLDTIMGQSGSSLSGGQAHRVAIARALYKRSSLLLMDEPTSALDNYTAKVFLDRLKQFNKDQLKIIVTHSHEVKSIADKILDLGEV